MTSSNSSSLARSPQPRSLAKVSLGALGVVYGDIGTSPLYALRQCFFYTELTPESVLGVLSLIFWSLVLVISVKYMVFVLRADNEGEGGILVLMTLAVRGKRKVPVLVGLGLFGAALLYGDGMITPAISVLGAIEGLHVATPGLEPYVVPLSILVLVGLFLFQRRGTERVAAVFGPITLIWFLALATLGLNQLIRKPDVLVAVSPVYALSFLATNTGVALLILGAVFLVVTGGEALYADLGHFGTRPIRVAWFCIAFPALLLNYFGQGVLLIQHPEAIQNPFYLLAPRWALYPLVLLATMATVIASQAIISGAFSLSYQAVQFGYLPRLKVVHTSDQERGQIYVPFVNWVLMFGVTALVLAFQSAAALAGAYGIAVSSTMLITTVLIYRVARDHWGWNPVAIAVGAGLFACLDLAFLGANLLKIGSGGWLPLLIALIVFTLMWTWRKGRRTLASRLKKTAIPLEEAIPRLVEYAEKRTPGTAVYMTSNPRVTPPALVHGTKHYSVLHERVVLMSFSVEDVPRVPAAKRISIDDLGHGFYTVRARFGFQESPLVTRVISRCARMGFEFDLNKTTFFVGREALIAGREDDLPVWQAKLFDWLSRNARRATDSFQLPGDRVVEIGVRVEL